MTIDLSFTTEPSWRAQREVLWEKIEDNLKDKYTRKELAMVKGYYFDGILDEKGVGVIYDARKVLFFPLRTPEGWNYVMQHHMKGHTDFDELEKARNGYDSILNSLLTYSMREIGRDWEFAEQCALFDWLVGEHYQEVITSPVPIGPQEQVTHLNLTPDKLYSRAVCGLASWLKTTDEDKYRYNLPVWIDRLNYLFELVPMVDERVFDIKLHQSSARKKSGGRVDWDQECLQEIFQFMKNFPQLDIPEEELIKRRTFLSDFHQCLEALDLKPGQLQQQLDKLYG